VLPSPAAKFLVAYHEALSQAWTQSLPVTERHSLSIPRAKQGRVLPQGRAPGRTGPAAHRRAAAAARGPAGQHLRIIVLPTGM
jgi:hypothetical protein